MKQSINIIKLFHGLRHVPYEVNGKLAWGGMRQFERWPLDHEEREIVKNYGHVPCDTSKEWGRDFTMFCFANIDKQYFDPTASAMLEYALSNIEHVLSGIAYWPFLTEARRGVLVDIAYKNGIEAVASNRMLTKLASDNKWDSIASDIIADANNAGAHQLPCHNNPFGSRSYYLAEMARTGAWPNWAA